MKLHNPFKGTSVPVSVTVAAGVLAVLVWASFFVAAIRFGPWALSIVPASALARLLFYIFKGK